MLRNLQHSQTGREYSGKPLDVSTGFRSEHVYSGDATEPLRRNFAIFKSAVVGARLDLNTRDTMVDTFPNYFLHGEALSFYLTHIESQASNMNDAV